jgi:hypothetical protein
MVDNAFDLRLFKAKNHIDDALGVAKRGQRPMQPMRPMPMMQPPMPQGQMPPMQPRINIQKMFPCQIIGVDT